MSSTVEKLQQELQAARDTIVELQARVESRETTHRLATLELQENRSALLFMLEDLENARKKIEHSHKEWMDALDVVKDPIFMHDAEYRILRCNKAYQQCAALPFHDIIGRPYYEIFPKSDGPLSCCLRAMEKAAAGEEELVVGDTTYRSRAFSINDEHGVYLYSVHIMEDVTESRRAERLLRENEQNYRTLADAAPALIWASGIDKLCNYFNQPWLEFTGRALEQELGNSWTEGVHPDDLQHCLEVYLSAFERREPFSMEYRMRRHDGEYRWMRDDGCPRYDSDGAFIGYIGYLMDVTERKLAEIAVNHANRALSTLSAVNRSLVRANDEGELLQSICRSIVEQRGYRMAWVGYVQHDEHKSIKIMASAGHDEGYLDAINVTWAETERGMGPTGRAIRSGTTELCQDFANDPRHLPWRDAALKRGYAASIALPLANGEVFGALTVYADEVNAFSPAEVELLEEMAGDMAFGVRTLHVRRERDLALEQNRRQLKQLESNLEETVRAIATIVEMRDPYTAGHQARVADLAAAIARQMGLPDDRVHGIHLAGVLHDLGKIQVPAEILSKPGRISEIEHSLIKVHPQAGYDILKGIDFPWPIAQMVQQHHERLDGSGYPQGLKGDAILFEARILSVADVVESMSSHRPYRPGWGVDAALEEITQQRGIHFDPQVVDACLAQFCEQGYRLPD